jgi:hypothetical protein
VKWIDYGGCIEVRWWWGKLYGLRVGNRTQRLVGKKSKEKVEING